MPINEAEILSTLNVGISKDPITDAVIIALSSVNESAIQKARDLIIERSKSKSGTSASTLALLPISQNKNVYGFEIVGDDILFLLDKGVSGTERKYDTPLYFKSSFPNEKMASAIRNWVPKTGFTLPQGFKSYDSWSYAIAAGVKKRGIEPKKFIDESFGSEFVELLKDALSFALGKAVEIKFDQLASKFNSGGR